MVLSKIVKHFFTILVFNALRIEFLTKIWFNIINTIKEATNYGIW
nr:MAG TPA: hypothetical protein [Caudoviricetes sp.]